ncbi:tricorn protease [Janthinobacterium sp. S3M3]|nr:MULTISPECIES: S41 family peptidase [unclassified Janthinobacterium]MBB5606390.1 tricorn protease [Janthinobacterium sp. S3T4]MBB5611738.1 tricorn protease [Janthinobacterium sp. S3M3]
MLVQHLANAAIPRYPQAYGGKIVFSANEKLWRVPRAGGVAVQLTSGEGQDIYPRVSPDGRWIAYTKISRSGSDVLVMPSEGGVARRLTYHQGRGLDNIVVTWSPDSSKVIYLSKHAQWNPSVQQLYEVPVSGGLPQAMPIDSAVGLATFAPDGHTIAYNRIFSQYGNWKRYDGGMARQIFTYDFKSRQLQQITHWSGTNAAPMWYGRKIYYLSDQDSKRRANLWVHDLETGRARQITHFTQYDIDSPALGDDAITFQQGGTLYRMDLPDERLHAVAVSIVDDHRYSRKRIVALKDAVRDSEIVHNSDLPDRINYAISPDGQYGLFSARGQLFSLPAQPGAARHVAGTSGTAADRPAWSPDGRLVAYITEVDGNQQLAIRPADGGKERVLTQFRAGYFFAPVFAPDGRSLALSDGDHRLWLIGLDGSAPRQVALDKRQGIHDQSFSPDGRWLAFSMAATGKQRDLYLYEISSGRTHRLGRGESTDALPAWSPDGDYLYFTSARYVQAVPSDQENDFAMVKSTGIYAIHFSALVGGIDSNDLMAQALALPVEPANIVQLDARQGYLYYLTKPIALFDGVLKGEQWLLHRYDVKTGQDSVIAKDLDSYSLSYDGKKVLLKNARDYSVLDAVAGTMQQLDLDQLRIEIDPPAEWAQMFNDAWRLERDLFISSTMNGQNWEQVRERYAALLPQLGSRSDLNWLLSEMLGELGNSHVYVGGGDNGDTGPIASPARLGVDWELDQPSGRYRINRIYAGDNTRPAYRSPLRQPGLQVSAGDYVLAINGEELRAPTVPDALLQTSGAAKPVELTIAGRPDGPRRRIRVKPVGSELNLRELDWIGKNRQLIDCRSDGRVGYVYLSNMGQRGLEQFTQQFYAQLNRQALIIDDRWNGGGSVAEYLLERLRRTQVAFTTNRSGAMDTQPEELLRGPKVVLVNHWTGSNGELFPYLFQQYGLGQVVGTRTWGGLRGYNGDTPLLDGGYITIPVRAVLDLNGKAVVENHGVDPDMEVENMPADLLDGHDAQLETALSLMLKAIAGKTNEASMDDNSTARVGVACCAGMTDECGTSSSMTVAWLALALRARAAISIAM